MIGRRKSFKVKNDLQKVSFREMFRYSTPFDRLLLSIGSTVAIATGFGFPLMAVIMGSITQSFVNATILLHMKSMDPNQLSTYLTEQDTFGTSHSFAARPFNESQEYRVLHKTPEEIMGYSMDQFETDLKQSCFHYTLLGITMFFAAALQVVCFLIACENRIHRLRKTFFEAIVRQEIGWFDRNHTGTLATTLFDNLERIREGTGDKLALLIQYFSQFAGGFVIAFIYNWKMTIIMLSLTPLLFLAGLFVAKVTSKFSLREGVHYKMAGGIAEEVLVAIRTVIAYNGQKREAERYDNSLRDGRDTGIVRCCLVGIGLAMIYLVVFLIFCVAFWVGTDFVYNGSIRPGTVLTVFVAVLMGSLALGQGGPHYAVFGSAQGAAAAVYSIIDRVPDTDPPPTNSLNVKSPRLSTVSHVLSGSLSFKDVHFSYPSRKDHSYLNGFTLDVHPGETIALVGCSGCGKSTVLQLLLRYYRPSQGQILLDGRPISSLPLSYLRGLIGVVSQEPNLFNTTIEENIRYGREDVTDCEIVAACRRANATNFITSFPDGMKTVVGDRGTHMSGGQKQRIAIARVLVRNPRILLLDEATSALDVESESVVQKAIEKASEGRTTIVVAHRLNTIKSANRIVAMREGRVQEIGTHEELMKKKGVYYDLVTRQTHTESEERVRRNTMEAPPLICHSPNIFERRSSIFDVWDRRGSTFSRRSQNSSVFSDREVFVTQEGELEVEETPESEIERLKREVEEEGVDLSSGIMKLLSFSRPEWKFIFLTLFSATIQGLVFPSCSIFFTKIVELFANPDRERMLSDGHFYSLLLGSLGLVQGIGIFGQNLFSGCVGERVTFRLRSAVFRSLLSQDISFFDNPLHSTGRLTTRLAMDAPNVKGAIDYRLGSVLSSFVSICAGVTIAFLFGWQMALLVICLYPLAGLGQALQLRYEQRDNNDIAKKMEESGKIAIETIENIRTVQALGLEKKFHEKFSHLLNVPHKAAQKRAIFQGLAYGFANSIPYFLYASTFRFGIWLVSKGISTPMNVMKVQFAISLTAGSLGGASAYYPEYAKARLASALVFNLIEKKSSINGCSEAGKKPLLQNIHGSIRLDSVCFAYPQRRGVTVLKGMDLHVEKGKTLALVGPSGCGKSTVIQLLERFYDPLSGTVSIDGVDIRQINPAHLRDQIGLVSQEPVLFNCSIKDNILYGTTDVSQQKLMEVVRVANIESLLEKLPRGYNTFVGERGTQLSGGQKQRIAIARALVRDPNIILLDEATSALDSESEKMVQEALDRACRGRTSIVIAHRLSTIINADCIAVVKSGQIVEKGTHQELMKKRGHYYDLHMRHHSQSE